MEIETYIDVTLSRGLDEIIANWSVNTDFNGSDHNTIEFNLDLSTVPESEEVRLWDSTDWLYFKTELKKNEKLLYVPMTLDKKKTEKMLDKLYLALNRALDRASPLVRPSTKCRSFYWYNGEHKSLSKEAVSYTHLTLPTIYSV